MTAEPDIVIVGAGAAGIGAARRLAGSGLSVQVIEALPRTGGRAWTCKAAGVPLDLGCEWLHSGDRNPWTRIAGEAGFTVDRRPPAWGTQYHDLGFPSEEQEEADRAFTQWNQRLAALAGTSDRAADALEPGGRWNPYLQALSGFISGDTLERISVQDYAAYDAASTGQNWRVMEGYGTLITASLPDGAALRLATPVEAIGLEGSGVRLATPAGTINTRLAILTVSTHVLASDAIRLPPALDPWREAAARLPLGRDEKLFLEIVGNGPFAPESHVTGDPHDAATGAYYIRPFGWPVIECFLGADGARAVSLEGADAAFERAIGQIVRLFGAQARRHLRPLVASDWFGTPSIGGAYSHALPGQAAARGELARPFDGRLLFAGEATHATDFSTAHGAYESGRRAAEQAIAILQPDRRS
ncbi:flavin monoamine oxidase family protein [Ancylobacter defluvii]|uniref:Tryptophan 2-monooxygenase n=1 Tax=Ancylobacter defluvii TaxID=1282440 RepID=A0A9W6JYK0_9HYPH|nr:NAD(P)/FAD-dependent oxidoreductase [Ancylobacter defluvii]MBS7589092.1 FAD-dependent oxidoreductase [Ancylobacter defluvii]GLK84704.1 amine oxidase [Ancylobacter defluvii]